MGHQVEVVAVDETADRFDHQFAAKADVLIALHACRSAAVVRGWADRWPARPLVVALTGTDLYVDLPESATALGSIERADRLIVLQAAAVDRLRSIGDHLAAKARVVRQSLDVDERPPPAPETDEFRVVVLAHLRDVKDPLLAARAAAGLGPDSRVRVHHAGRALDAEWERRVRAEVARNPRYRWHGELERSAALALLGTGHVLACTSVHEGGANVVTEAIAMGVPVVGTRMDGNTGLLGDEHPGLFPVGDDKALTELLHRLESDPTVLADLQARSHALAPTVSPAAERDALAAVLAELS